MSTRTRKTTYIGDDTLYDQRDLGVDLESVSDEELEALLFEEEKDSSNGFFNLPTIAGLSLILVGIVYMFQEMGFPAGPDLGFIIQMLPLLAGILIILLGFGVLSWRPKPKQKKVKTKGKLHVSHSPHAAGSAPRTGRRRLTKSRNKKIAGVAAGIAEQFNIDPTVIRIAWVISVFMTNGLSILFYAAMAYILPPPETMTLEERITILRDS